MSKTPNIAPPTNYHPPVPFERSKVSGSQVYLVALLIAGVVAVAAIYFFGG